MENDKKYQTGLTFLELLVAVTLLALIVVAATNLFFSLIRGGGKVDVGTEVKQNGQAALSTMEQLIRNAGSVTGCSPTSVTSIQIVDKSGQTISLACEDLDDADLQTGYISNTIGAQPAVRLTSSKVVVTDCSFTCNVGGGTASAPLVSVSFTLKQIGEASQKYKQAEATFSTSVVLRNYQ